VNTPAPASLPDANPAGSGSNSALARLAQDGQAHPSGSPGRAPSGRTGQALALFITLLGVAAIWLVIVSPVLEWHQERVDQLRRDQELARRMAALVDTLPALREAARNTGQEARPAALLTGQTDAIAAAALQQKLEEMAATAGLRIGSEEIMPPQALGPLRAISVRITVSAPWQALVRLLQVLAESDMPMIADDVQLRGPATVQRASDPPIEGSLVVTGFRGNDGQAP
jgi:general secretion pathway protein M